MIPTNLFRSFDGPLTRELVRTPGKFGLGQVPATLAPDSVTTLVCGYCSTGCGLRAHMKNGEVVNVSADPRYPVNLGMACPKGWEALTPAKSPDRATTPLLRENGTSPTRASAWPPRTWPTSRPSASTRRRSPTRISRKAT